MKRLLAFTVCDALATFEGFVAGSGVGVPDEVENGSTNWLTSLNR